ncbi:MAG: hypothetical protein K1X82_04440, partial [Bacteroidia bacterium]|nr:hypothetical protein [Bacteroidia bacterium]
PSLHQHMDPSIDSFKVEVLEVEQDFYMEFNPWKKPDKRKIAKTFQFKPFHLNEKEFKDRLYARRFDQEPNFIEKLKTGFGLLK